MLVAFSVSPMGESDSVGTAVAECVRLVRESGLPHETTAMFTTVEGEWEQIQALLAACMDTAAQFAPRVSVTMKIDHRPGVEGQLRGKVERVEQVLAEDAEREI